MPTLASKLHLRDGATLLLANAPAEIEAQLRAEIPSLHIIHSAAENVGGILTFVRSRAEVAALAPGALAAAAGDQPLWFAYPKKSGSIPSDLSRESGWEPVLAAGFDSVAQIAINETWTGYRFRATHHIGKRQ